MSQTMSKLRTVHSIGTAYNLLEAIFPSPRNFSIQLWDASELYAAKSKQELTLVINQPGSLRRMFTPPVELSLGKAYIYGDIDIEGDICDWVTFLDLIFSRQLDFREFLSIGQKVISLPNKRQNELVGRGPVKLRGTVYSRARDRAAISYQ